MNTFNEVFQSRLACDGVQGVTLDVLLNASEQSSLSQVPLVTTRVNRLTKEIASNRQLYQYPVLAYVETDNEDEEPEMHLVSGRHRVAAISEIVNNWGQTASGKWCQVATPEQRNSGALTFVEGIVDCLVIGVSDEKTLAELVLTANGSRSMTAAETALSKVNVGSAGKKTSAQLEFATELHVSIPTLTFQTCFTLASKLFGAKRTSKLTGDTTYTGLYGLEKAEPVWVDIIAAFQQWFTDPTTTLPPNVARNIDQVSNAFIAYLGSTLNATQTQTLLDELKQAIADAAPAPKEKGKGSKVSDLTAQLQEAQRLIAELKAQQGL